MKKRISLLILVNLILVSGLVLAAQPIIRIGTDEVEHTVELISVEEQSAIFKIDDDTRIIGKQPSEPYTLHSSPRVPDLKFIVTDARIRNLDFNVTFLVGFEINFSVPSGREKINITIDGVKHPVWFIDANDNEAIIQIDDETYAFTSPGSLDSQQYQGPYTLNKPTKKISDFWVILKDANERNLELSASFLILYEKNFFVGGCNNDCVWDEKTCDGNGFKTCGDYDEDICWEWSVITNCNSDETCENGVCVDRDVPVTCRDSCVRDEKKCFNTTSYQACGNYDSDSCLEWSKATLCPIGPVGRACSKDGECVTDFPDPNPNPEPTRECEQIGLRENVKYCSLEYKWENQKIDRADCNNNFECKGNDCKEGICGKAEVPINESDKSWIIWLIAGGIILVIFLVIYLIIKR